MNKTKQTDKDAENIMESLNYSPNKTLKSSTMQTIRNHMTGQTPNTNKKSTHVEGTTAKSDILLLKRAERVRSMFIKKRDG